ncbi:polyribonucleotide nucleotidyltransferase [Candidatus Latescibacterota bacterium]
MTQRVEMELGGRQLSMETGKVAKQANGAVWVRYGDTIVLVTACRAKRAGDRDFLPLTVEYREKTYAAGRIPGNFFKREGRMGEKETLSARATDHLIRPMFPKSFRYEVQVFITVLSVDGENDPDVLGMLGASTALCLSDIPFARPVGAVRVGRVDGDLLVNPTTEQLDASDMDMIVSGTEDSISTVEGGAHEISEEALLECLEYGHEQIQGVLQLQQELIAKAGKEKMTYEAPVVDPELVKAVEEMALERITAANHTTERDERQLLVDGLHDDVHAALAERFPEAESDINSVIYDLVKADMRRMVLEEKRRIDGRKLDEVRPITCETGVIPRAHGSALFTRGQTQALAVATLGNKYDEKMIDDLRGKSYKSYFLDYNFPAYSTNEVSFPRGPGRREIGHGHLAERAIEPVIPAVDSFPYTIRLVSDIQESNGSTSMATVCGSSLALMDAGVPVKTAVTASGVGLISEGDQWELLTDIQGSEDFLGDMDLKVAGTVDGITAVQMENKIQGIRMEILEEALQRARLGRMHILEIMNESISTHREELSTYAPRIEFVKIDPSKIGAVIGPGGKMIRQIESTGASLNVEDDGTITVSSVEASAAEQAKAMIMAITADAVIGQLYEGTVKRIMPFGAFVEILPGKEGLCHISELAHNRVRAVEDVVEEGQNIAVKVLDIDNSGKIRLSHKATLDKPQT